jgi:hypothetical protein
MCNCTSEDAPLGAGPESILPIMVMDSGLAQSLDLRRDQVFDLHPVALLGASASTPSEWPGT